MPLPSLPNDIIHAVLAEVARSDLCSCALVHSTWLHSVRHHLYKQIAVDLEEGENPLIVATLASEAHLRPFVRSLDFDGSWMSEDGTRPNADVLDMAQERELAEVWDEDMLGPLLLHTPKLRNLRVTGATLNTATLTHLPDLGSLSLGAIILHHWPPTAIALPPIQELTYDRRCKANVDRMHNLINKLAGSLVQLRVSADLLAAYATDSVHFSSVATNLTLVELIVESDPSTAPPFTSATWATLLSALTSLTHLGLRLWGEAPLPSNLLSKTPSTLAVLYVDLRMAYTRDGGIASVSLPHLKQVLIDLSTNIVVLESIQTLEVRGIARPLRSAECASALTTLMAACSSRGVGLRRRTREAWVAEEQEATLVEPGIGKEMLSWKDSCESYF